MGPKEDVIALLNMHKGKEWIPNPPATEVQIAEVEKQLGYRFCEPYRQFLLNSSSGYFETEMPLNLFKLIILPEYNVGQSRFPGLEGMLVFASDGGDYIYYMYPDGKLGKGVWAVFMAEQGTKKYSIYSMFLARNYFQFLERVFSGDSFYKEPHLKDEPKT